MTSDAPVVLRDDTGAPVLRYVPGTRDGRPLADLAEALVGPGAAAPWVMAGLPGTVVACDERLGRALEALGAAPLRHSHVMTHDLGAVGAGQAEPVPDRLRLVPIGSVAPAALLPSWWAAYPPRHVDAVPVVADEAALAAHLLPYLVDGALGEVIVPASAAVVDADDAVVAAILVNHRAGSPPFGGPWVTEVWCDPAGAPRGTGAMLLRRALAALAGAGADGLSLAVTAGNPAQAVYTRLGFTVAWSGLTVLVPPES